MTTKIINTVLPEERKRQGNIKLIIFDLDGVLVDLRDVHFEALNDALESIDPKYVISKEEHLSMYDGLSTLRKLEKLGMPMEFKDEIWKRKQEYTVKKLNVLYVDARLSRVFWKLKIDGYTIAVASNSIRETVKIALLNTGLMRYVDFYYSNEDVKNPKPNPEMYYKCMIKAGVSAKDTLIIEDSKVGRESVIASGANLMTVTSSNDVTYERITNMIAGNHITKKWVDHDLTIVIPMAGAGKRFQDAGYTFPKPLIDVKGKPMIQCIIENLNIDAHYVFIVQKSHHEQFNLKYFFNLLVPNNTVVVTDGITEGAACTTLLAEQFMTNKPLLLANSDQIVKWDSSDFMWSMQGEQVDGGIVTFNSTHPKWSFAKVEGNKVIEVAEKKPISDVATVGIYYWRNGKEYVKYAKQMIKKNIRTNNEFYVCPVYNEAIQDGKYIKNYHVDTMWGLGTPEDLRGYLNE